MSRWVPALLVLLAMLAVPAAASAAHNITISNQPTTGMLFSSGTYLATIDNAVLNTGDLADALASGDVRVSTAGLGVQAGNITVSAPIVASTIDTLTLDANASISLGANVNVGSGYQVYESNVVLTAPVTVTGDIVEFTGSINGPYDLTSNAGNTKLEGPVGGSTPLASLTIGAGLVASGGSITTVGNQTFEGGVLLNADMTLTATGSGFSFSFESIVTGASDLQLAGAEARFLGDVGGIVPLSSLTSSGPTTLGGSVTTTGTQTYSGPVTLSSDVTLTGANLSLAATNGAHALALVGNAALASAGTTTRLTSISASGTTTLAGAVKTVGDQTWGPLTFSASAGLDSSAGTSTVNGGVLGDVFTFPTFTVNGAGAITGAIAFTTLVKEGSGALVLSGVTPSVASAVVKGGNLIVNGSFPSVQLDGGLLGGSGTAQSVTTTANGGVIDAGSGGPGVLATGSLVLNSSASFAEQINGATPGTGYDQVTTNAANLGNAALNLTLGYTPVSGQSFMILNKISPGPIVGTFKDLPEGGAIDLGAVRLQISYAGGDGNDVTLTRVAQPTTLALAAAPGSSIAGDAITLTATVTGAGGTPAQSGTVTFSDGGTTLGSAPVVNGVATLITSALAEGEHQLAAAFTSSDYGSSSGTTDAHVGPKPVDTTTPSQDSGGGTQQQSAQPPAAETPSASTVPGLTIEGGTAKEGSKRSKRAKRNTVVFTFTLSEAASTPLTITYTTRNGTAKAGRDYVKKSGKLTFRAGQTKLTVRIQVIPDLKKEKAETFRLVAGKVHGTGRIRDDDRLKRR